MHLHYQPQGGYHQPLGFMVSFLCLPPTMDSTMDPLPVAKFMGFCISRGLWGSLSGGWPWLCILWCLELISTGSLWAQAHYRPTG